MADEAKDAAEKERPRRGDGDKKPAAKTEGNKPAAEKKESPKPAMDVSLDKVLNDGLTQKALITARCSKGPDAVIGVVQFYCNGTATGEPRPTNSGGIATIWIENLPLTESAITIRAQVLGSSLMGLSALTIPAVPKKEAKDPSKIGAVEFLEAERQPSTGRNIIPVLVYDENGKVMPGVVVWVIDAACMSDPPLPPTDPRDIHTTDHEGRVAIDYTISATEKVRDVTVVVPRKPSAFRRYVLRGPDPVSRKPQALPIRRPGESHGDFRQRCRDAGRGVVR